MAVFEPDYFSRQVLSAKRFYRNQFSVEGSAIVSGGGCEFCAENFMVERESFPFITLEFVSAGRGIFEIGGASYKLEPGNLIYYGPEHPHKISAVQGSQLHKYFLTVLPYEGFPGRELYGKVFSTSEPMSIYNSFEELIKYGSDPSESAGLICSGLYRLLINKCQLHFLEYSGQHDSRYRTYIRCKTSIAENFLSLRSLREAASFCAVSEAYLCKLFSKYDNFSPYTYLMKLRMQSAAVMLQDERKTVNEVALELGYEDQGHFTRAFKRLMGAAPSDFRV
ncbi:MAG: AraC family transcriptional regulator [Spirochaetales bacterium]|uniref:AraC family transcriptional regulator n=1 Tax=Candidatus Thalassospirochaeta sargassi TaxID=3119039 RepID=A0AAJ1IGP8_9SPIO|nr:AraC family transcriptional regulator [Spirochaetales bacterium]